MGINGLDKKRSVLNVSISIISRVILLFAALFVRRLLIQCIGNDVNGLNSLYTDILGVLAVAELGVGRAIIYSMYGPIVSGDRIKVTALYCLYKRIYRIIGLIIFYAGLLVTPFLPMLISDYKELNPGVNVYLTFELMLISVVISYFYSAKTALIEAHKDNYITTGINTVSSIFIYVLQIASILLWRSFTAFIICKIIGTLLIWVLSEIVARRKYGDILNSHEMLNKETEKEIIRNVKAMFMHKIGTIMVNGVDSIVISIFIGVVSLGKYNNYTYIAGILAGTIALFFSPLTSIIGHLCASKDAAKTKRYFSFFYSLNFALGLVFFLGYYAIIDELVVICFGEGLQIIRSIVFAITLNQFIVYLRNAQLLFRNASGTFYNDRWKPLAEGVANLVLSLILVIVLPGDIRIVGVIIATIITSLFICHVVEPYVIFRHVFNSSPKSFYIRNYLYIALFTACLFLMTFIKDTVGVESENSVFTKILVYGFISVGISVIALGLVAVIDKEFRNNMLALRKNLRIKEWKT